MIDPAFESAVFERRYDDACDCLVQLLEKPLHRAPRADVMNATRGECTRITAAVLFLIMAPEWRPTVSQFQRLCRVKARLAHIVGAGAYGSLDVALTVVAARIVPTEDAAAGVDKALKMLLCYDFNTAIDFPFARIARAIPQAAMAAYFPLLSDPVVVTAGASRERQKLLDLAGLFEGEKLEDYLIGPLSDAWFMCSYDHRPAKHDFKASLNRIVRRWIGESAPALPVVLPAERDRPVVLVAADVFKSTHALYRCYQPLVESLRPEFRVVLMCAPRQMDRVAAGVVDEIVPVDFDPSDSARLFAAAAGVKPDIVFFPSLGMSHWTVTMANGRSAPIQIASQGHPATSRSDCIDFLVSEERFAGDPGCYSEKLVFLSPGALQFRPHPDGGGPPPSVRVEPGTVRIAVNSVAAKLSVPFLEVCSELARRSERALEFHFLAGLPPVSTSHLTDRLRTVLPSAVVHPWSDFGTYLERLSACDLQLATFPFGGTNTVGDSLAAGLPVVAMRGPEPHSTVDAAMVGMVGLPDWMVATDSEGYLAAAQRLLVDDGLRVRLSETLLQQDLSEAFHDPAYHNHSCDFAEVIRWLLQHHDEVRLSEKKVWRADDRERIDLPAIGSPA